jgi:membrane-bound lytic murein transglycosylase MltF
MASALEPAADEFSAIHAELDRAADNALADTVQHMAAVASDDGRDKPVHSPESLILDFDQRYRSTTRPNVNAALKRLYQLRPVLEPILQSEGIPAEIASVVVVESGGRTNALSPKGALGLWQLMPDTARRYGLEVAPRKDERLDAEKSTRAAVRYLRDLYQQFGSWPLALAGYNAGEAVLQRAVDRAGSSDFLQLSSLRLLPQETRNYVPAVLSAMQLLGNYRLPEAPTGARMSPSGKSIFAVPGAQP